MSLPHVATSFVGHAAELAAIEAAFATLHARLLTLHGPAGAGKSCFTIAAAWRFVGEGQAADGAYFVPLETVGEASAVATAVARVMGLTPSLNRTPEAQVLHAIAGRSVLVVPDNVEHLVGCAPFVASILQTCARARLLAAVLVGAPD